MISTTSSLSLLNLPDLSTDTAASSSPTPWHPCASSDTSAAWPTTATTPRWPSSGAGGLSGSLRWSILRVEQLKCNILVGPEWQGLNLLQVSISVLRGTAGLDWSNWWAIILKDHNTINQNNALPLRERLLQLYINYTTSSWASYCSCKVQG